MIVIDNQKIKFKNNGGQFIDIGEFPKDDAISNAKRAVTIMQCYGGLTQYKQSLSDDGYKTEFRDIKNLEGKEYIGTSYRSTHKGDNPFQTIPENSPLGKVKTITQSHTTAEPIKFTDYCSLSEEDIRKLKIDQARVVRFALKSKFEKDDDNSIRQKCFTDKERAGESLKDCKRGLYSSYITPLTLHLQQTGPNAGSKAKEKTRIYYTGFGYSLMNYRYLDNPDDFIKDEFKAIFKQKIFATLRARQQQIEFKEITPETKVPLILNRPFDFVDLSKLSEANKLQDLANTSLVELFNEKEVKDQLADKIDQILIWDPAKKITHEQNVKFFGDINKFEFASGIKTLDMTGLDMISVAQLYHKNKRIMMAILGMVNLTHQDGKGRWLGLEPPKNHLMLPRLE